MVAMEATQELNLLCQVMSGVAPPRHDDCVEERGDTQAPGQNLAGGACRGHPFRHQEVEGEAEGAGERTEHAWTIER